MCSPQTGTTSRRRAGGMARGGTTARRGTTTEGKESTRSRRASSTEDLATRRLPRTPSAPRVATPSGPSNARRPARLPRQAPTTADGIPVFDRNKVSLDFPGNLFGPSVSLLIKTTKIVGDVIQNSAVRYQTFLRLFRPLFRGQFEIKGLDPPTTTTTTPAPPPPPAADNEVRRRRGA
ncbi:hypothetical protein JYU34_004820 [Plutella xylostella]|uniref:Uncharacterized protein n=1 Tax=Plutella xylostella TaxID=51655 RepID=A0ABQ7QVA3_PLUXY|nr:hypothetical protein JYU34_004820 [Plutella xylostella]